MAKKFLAMLIALTMVIALLPTVALAVEDEADDPEESVTDTVDSEDDETDGEEPKDENGEEPKDENGEEPKDDETNGDETDGEEPEEVEEPEDEDGEEPEDGEEAEEVEEPEDEETAEPEEAEPVSFSDVSEKDWFYDAVRFAVENGLMNGYPNGSFGPYDDTSRAMLVTILYRMEGEPEVETAVGFTDVKDGEYYTEAVAWAAANNIVNGYTDGTFGPTTPINREQFVTILYRYAQYKGLDTTAAADLAGYTDVGEVQGYALDAMKWAKEAELITGITVTTLVPGGSAIRAQTATILMRFCALIEDAEANEDADVEAPEDAEEPEDAEDTEDEGETEEPKDTDTAEPEAPENEEKSEDETGNEENKDENGSEEKAETEPEDEEEPDDDETEAVA